MTDLKAKLVSVLAAAATFTDASSGNAATDASAMVAAISGSSLEIEKSALAEVGSQIDFKVSSVFN